MARKPHPERFKYNGFFETLNDFVQADNGKKDAHLTRRFGNMIKFVAMKKIDKMSVYQMAGGSVNGEGVGLKTS